jgi:hypothetical protein
MGWKLEKEDCSYLAQFANLYALFRKRVYKNKQMQLQAREFKWGFSVNKWSEVKWCGVNWSDFCEVSFVKWFYFEVKWSDVEWTEVIFVRWVLWSDFILKWSEVK